MAEWSIGSRPEGGVCPSRSQLVSWQGWHHRRPTMGREALGCPCWSAGSSSFCVTCWLLIWADTLHILFRWKFQVFLNFKTAIDLIGTELYLRLPRWCSDKESTYQCRRCKRNRFDPSVGKMSRSRKWQYTPVFLPGKLHGQRRLVG